METPSACPYCAVGCGVLIKTENAKITGVRGDPNHPANFGRLCTKGATLHLSATRANRVLYPEVRLTKDQPRLRTLWPAALGHAADKFAEIIKQHGPDAVAFYISGQLLTEDYYVFNKLAKGLIGTNNVDTNSRLCMSSAVAGYKLSLGADAPPACFDDIDHAQTHGDGRSGRPAPHDQTRHRHRALQRDAQRDAPQTAGGSPTPVRQQEPALRQ